MIVIMMLKYFFKIKKITDHFISKNSLSRDIFALLTFLMTTITNRWDIKGYRGISRHIKGNQGISWDMEGYQGTLRDIEGYRGMSRDITIITYVGKLVGYRGISTIQSRDINDKICWLTGGILRAVQVE